MRTSVAALRSLRSARRASTRALPRIVKTGASRVLSASLVAMARRIRVCGMSRYPDPAVAPAFTVTAAALVSAVVAAAGPATVLVAPSAAAT
jgi:hypothetical protein